MDETLEQGKNAEYRKISGVWEEKVIAVSVVKRDSPEGLFYQATEFWTTEGKYIGETV